MNVLRTIAEVREWRLTARSVGFVPTMGALHAGHLSLLERAKESGAAVVSIFVNPTQFGPTEDYTMYPRREAEDLAMLEAAGTSTVFLPGVEEMYPPGDTTRIQLGAIADPLEGAARPGHFVGVATVVTKLFAIVEPDVSYFGQKDFQQLRVLQTVARDLRLRTRVVGRPIVREQDGMALSSRNAYLDAEQRRDAVTLSRGLAAAEDLWQTGERDPERLRQRVRKFANAPLVSLEYVSAADPITLVELDAPAERAVLSLAARVGNARLIDNALLGMDVSELS